MPRLRQTLLLLSLNKQTQTTAMKVGVCPFANRTSLSDKAKNKARFMLNKIKRIMESK